MIEEGQKLLLDTNIFRNFASGHYSQYEEKIIGLARNNPSVLWCSYLAFVEIAKHIESCRNDNFEFFRTPLILMWVDNLCSICDSGSSDEFWRAIAPDYTTRTHPGFVAEIDRLLKNILKLKSKDELNAKDLGIIKKIADTADVELNDWIDTNEHVIKEFKKCNVGHTDFAEFRDKAINGFIEMCIQIAKNGGNSTNARDEIKEKLKEEFYFRVFVLWKAYSNNYNFRKHRNDAIDAQLLSYISNGYTIITADDRLRKHLDESCCPKPLRIRTLEELMETL